MESIQENISNFLRDAQYRLGEITDILNNKIHDEESKEYKKLNYQRKQIWVLHTALYSGYRNIEQEGYLGFYYDWTEEEIRHEIERVRKEVEINEIPWVNFGRRVVEIINPTLDSPSQVGGSANIDPSEEGYLAVYKDQDTIKGISTPKYVGWVFPSITQYFERNEDFGYLLHPTYTAAEWQSENPTLNAGEIGFEIEGFKVVGWKVGPGRWNDLSYFGQTRYTQTVTTNPIGEAIGDLSGLTANEILERILNPYVAPQISNLKNNASGSFENNAIMEIGEVLSGTVVIQYSVSQPDNLIALNPINVDAGGIFNNEGDFPNGKINLSLLQFFQPLSITTLQIRLKARHQNGETPTYSTFIRFYPKLIWGVSSKSNLTAGEIANISQKKTRVTGDYKGDYDYNASGYLFIAIPSMLNPSNLSFSDVTNPSSVLPMDMTDLGQMVLNNGVGQYPYQIFRSTFNLTINQTVIRIS